MNGIVSSAGMVCAAAPKRFVLLFDDLSDVHLFKDVGQVPFQMHKHFGFDAEIVYRRNGERFPCVDGALNGLKLSFYSGSLYRYLVRCSREIDVLMLFHISTRTICRGLLYKYLNPQGCLYVKTDMSGDTIRYARWGERNFLTQIKRSCLFNRFARNVDIVSFETELAYRGVKNVDADRKLLIPNGFDSELPQWYGVERRTFETKENIVLLVGRHGDYAKNSELMLDALENMDHLEGWQVWFVGQMNDAFERRREAFLRQRPELSKQVVFTGQIDDKKELFELYSRSKLLCLTSRWESWGMVCVEAMAFGCVPVMTAVSSAVDITNYGKCGIIIESSDPQYWSNRLREIFSDMSSIKKLSDATREHFQRFEWKKILSHLDKKIKVIISSNTENGRN